MTQRSTFVLYAGGEFDKLGRRIPSAQSYSAIRDAMNTATHLFGGQTLLFGWGSYLSPTGDTIVEKSARIEIVADSDRRAEVFQIAATLRAALDANEVLVTETALLNMVSIHAPQVTN